MKGRQNGMSSSSSFRSDGMSLSSRVGSRTPFTQTVVLMLRVGFGSEPRGQRSLKDGHSPRLRATWLNRQKERLREVR